MGIVLDTYSFLSNYRKTSSELCQIISFSDEMTPGFIMCSYSNSKGKKPYKDVSFAISFRHSFSKQTVSIQSL